MVAARAGTDLEQFKIAWPLPLTFLRQSNMIWLSRNLCTFCAVPRWRACSRVQIGCTPTRDLGKRSDEFAYTAEYMLIELKYK
eukprot:810319-Pleurochrysis_carterae.AAC.1